MADSLEEADRVALSDYLSVQHWSQVVAATPGCQ
jgi:hypothetical protein